MVGPQPRAVLVSPRTSHALLSEEQIDAIVRGLRPKRRSERVRRGSTASRSMRHTGYLIHQFLSPHTNRRKDRWGRAKPVSDRNTRRDVAGVRSELPRPAEAQPCGRRRLTLSHALETAGRVQNFVDAIEVSYGTMEKALNIFRGGCPIDLILRVNPRYGRIPSFIQKLWKRFFLPRHLAGLKPVRRGIQSRSGPGDRRRSRRSGCPRSAASERWRPSGRRSAIPIPRRSPFAGRSSASRILSGRFKPAGGLAHPARTVTPAPSIATQTVLSPAIVARRNSHDRQAL